MSSTFVRGLSLIEQVAVDGPLTVTELSRRLGVDKAGVSRMVAAAGVDGWLARDAAGGVVLGPRLPVVAHHSELSGVLREAQPLVDAVAGVTGLFTQLYLAVGTGAMPVLSGGRPPVALPRPPALVMPLWPIAAGRALATLMEPDRVRALVPDGPLELGATLVGMRESVVRALAPDAGEPSGDGADGLYTRADVLAAIERIRATGVEFDHGVATPHVHCVAVPWAGLGAPAALAVIGPAGEVADRAALAEAVLREATAPGATRERVVARAAHHAESDRSPAPPV